MKKIETKINVGVIMIMFFMIGTLVGTAQDKTETYEEQVILQLPETYSIIKMHHKDHDHMVAEQTKFAYYTLVEEDLINDINYSILLKEFQDCSIKGCGFKNRTVFKDSTLSLYEKFSKVHVDWKIVSKALN